MSLPLLFHQEMFRRLKEQNIVEQKLCLAFLTIEKPAKKNDEQSYQR